MVIIERLCIISSSEIALSANWKYKDLASAPSEKITEVSVMSK